MLFNSHSFIFLFLPLTLLSFYALASRGTFRHALFALVFASLFFYAWWNPIYLPLLLASIATNYVLARGLHASRSKALLVVGIALNLALIGYFKYAGFFVSGLNDLTGSSHTLHTIILPLGISFFTFQQITFLVDTWSGNAKRYSLLDYCQFVTFFPQLIAGPIVHHHEMMPQFQQTTILANVRENLSVGLTIFIIGLFKKVVLADSVAVFATPVFDTAGADLTLTVYEAWVGAFAYTLQLYFDFSGYSDMAIGLARMFGIRLPLNFNSPYKAASIIDFWRRWHMTLSRFLRDYLYIPLGGSRHGSFRRSLNVFLTMLLGGLWHGAGWTFVVWGAMHGVFLLVNHLWRQWRIQPSSPPTKVSNKLKSWTWFILAHILTLLSVVFAWVVFRATSWDAALSLWQSMLGFNGVAVPASVASMLQPLNAIPFIPEITSGGLFKNQLFDVKDAVLWIIALIGIALVLPNTQQFMHSFKPVLEEIKPSAIQWRPSLVWLCVLSLTGTYTLLQLTGVSEFLYFQF